MTFGADLFLFNKARLLVGFFCASLLVGCGKNVASHSFSSKPLEIIPAVQFDGTVSTVDVSDRMARYHVPALSYSVLKGGEIVEVRVMGSGNSQTDLDTNTQFQAASLSKAVTALGVLALIEETVIQLDDPVNLYLRNWKLLDADEQVRNDVTIRQLLSHQGGVNVPSYPGFHREGPFPDLLDVLNGTEKTASAPVRVEFPTGQFHYSGGGMMVLQKLIEDVSGQPFEDFMQERLFKPLSMTRTTFKPDGSGRNQAIAHDWEGDPVENGWHVYPQQAAASLWSTPEDLARLLQMIARPWEQSVLSADGLTELSSPHGVDMGLGFGLEGTRQDNNLRISHAGSTKGYRAYMVLFPEQGDGAVVMTNGEGGQYLYNDILRTLSRDQGWPVAWPVVEAETQDRESERLLALEGLYDVRQAGFTLEILCNRLCEVVTPRGSRYEIRQTSENGFHLMETGDRLSRFESGTLSLWNMVLHPVQNTEKKEDQQ